MFGANLVTLIALQAFLMSGQGLCATVEHTERVALRPGAYFIAPYDNPLWTLGIGSGNGIEKPIITLPPNEPPQMWNVTRSDNLYKFAIGGGYG